MTICECGHDVDQHGRAGCLTRNEDDTDFCGCENNAQHFLSSAEAERDNWRMAYELAEANRATAEALAETLRGKIKQLESEIKYLSSTDHAADVAFERMAPIDWRGYEADETPLGIALDGQGDEVEG